MSLRLFKIMEEEVKLLELLLNLLEKQYNVLISVEKDVVLVSQIAEEIDETIRKIASLEIDKKDILQNKSLLEFVEKNGDESVKNTYYETLKLLDMISIQKDANYMFIKQQLFFTKSLIKAMTPKRNAEVYDNLGKIRK